MDGVADPVMLGLEHPVETVIRQIELNLNAFAGFRRSGKATPAREHRITDCN
jgi:hypothetical protein